MNIAELFANLGVTVTVTGSPAPHECGGSTYSDQTWNVTIGAWSGEIGGWALCGWLEKGAFADLDGAGLENWGSSQPGGWTVCSGDGQSAGLATATATDHGIVLHDGGYGSGSGSVQIGLEDMLEPDQVSAALASPDLGVALVALADRVTQAISDVGVDAPEPTPEMVWDEIGETAGLPDIIRAGHPWGSGQVIIVICKGDADYTVYMSTESWKDAVRKAAAQAAENIVEYLIEDEPEL